MQSTLFPRLTTVYLLGCALLLLHPLVATGSTPAPFWADQIDSALTMRDTRFASLTEGASVSQHITAWSNERIARVAALVNSLPDGNDPWSAFIAGILLQSDSGNATTPFTSALHRAKDDPGTTWLLFIEFKRYNQTTWMDSALTQLEKQMFTAGARSATVIARQLLHYGTRNKLLAKHDKTAYYYSWAHRFDPYETTSIRYRALTSFPLHLTALFSATAEYLTILRTSWITQFSLLHHLYHSIRLTLLLFVCMTMGVLSVKYFPLALHRLAHYYPENVPLWLRTLLASAIITATVAFGLLPFMWLLIFILWRYVPKNERFFLFTTLFMLIVAPFDAAMITRIDSILKPDSPPLLFSQATNEGFTHNAYSVSLYRQNSEQPDMLSSLTAHTYAIKNEAAVHYGRIPATDLATTHPEDPVVQTIAGIDNFLSGSPIEAQAFFEQAIAHAPQDVPAFFNLSRCYLAGNDATAAMDVLATAAEIEPVTVNTFIQHNDNHFSDQWPPLRQIMFPNYTPGQFWNQLFLPYGKYTDSTRTIWGLAFFGIPPGASSIFFILLALILIAVQKLDKSDRRIRRLFACKYCGRIICRKCTNGILCVTCSDATQFIRNPQTLADTRNAILTRFRQFRTLRSNLLNLLVPGSGTLLTDQPSYLVATLLIILSALSYSFWILVVFHTSFSDKTVEETGFLLFFPILFHLLSILFFLPVLIRNIRNLRRIHPAKREK